METVDNEMTYKDLQVIIENKDRTIKGLKVWVVILLIAVIGGLIFSHTQSSKEKAYYSAKGYIGKYTSGVGMIWEQPEYSLDKQFNDLKNNQGTLLKALAIHHEQVKPKPPKVEINPNKPAINSVEETEEDEQ